MKPIFNDTTILEADAKKKFHFPDYVMMENAASAMERLILKQNPLPDQLFIVCGKGNNGADGIALARKLACKIHSYILLLGAPKTPEAKIQKEMAEACKVDFLTENDFVAKLSSCKKNDVIVDCIFGTGFKGELPAQIKNLILKLNSIDARKIACDISSGLEFNADITVTMGALKSALFSDKAKAVSGKIITADLGISENLFTKCESPDAYLVEKTDAKLPYRKNKSAHKGNFGHAAVFCGEKSGAGIIAGSASLVSGSGLSSLIKTEKSDISQFKISPELMISDSIPENTTSILIGSGLGKQNVTKIINKFENWFRNSKKAAAVIDADMFYFPELGNLLSELNKIQDAKIILTPHPKELANLSKICGFGEQTTAEILEHRFEFGKAFTKKYKNTVLVMKSANTVIAADNQLYIISDGCQNLAKAGSGDVLAGIINGLLAQGYSAKDAAITGCELHALAAQEIGEEAFFLTPELLIKTIQNLNP